MMFGSPSKTGKQILARMLILPWIILSHVIISHLIPLWEFLTCIIVYITAAGKTAINVHVRNYYTPCASHLLRSSEHGNDTQLGAHAPSTRSNSIYDPATDDLTTADDVEGLELKPLNETIHGVSTQLPSESLT